MARNLLIAWLLAMCVACVGRGTQSPLTPCDSLPPQATTVEFLFTGDVMQHLPQIEAARRGEGYDYGPSFEAVRPLLRQADVTVVNLETTLSDRGPYKGYPRFRAPHVLADELARCGVDVACLANNHALDYGAQGVRRTLAALDSCGIRHTGVFADSADYAAHRILRLERAGIRVALVNYTYGTNGMPLPAGMHIHLIDTTLMANDLQEARQGSDCVVAVMHWGAEYIRQPNPDQLRLAAFLRRQGVEVIIGHHPHTIQPYEVDAAGVVFYSLGNFVSNQLRRYCDGGLMARVRITKEADGAMHYAAEALPVWVERGNYRITPLSWGDTLPRPEACRQFLSDAEQLLGWHPEPLQ